MAKLSDEMRGVVIQHMGARRSNGKLYGRYVKATVDAAVLRWADRVAELENDVTELEDIIGGELVQDDEVIDDAFMDGYNEGFEDGQADAIASFYGGT